MNKDDEDRLQKAIEEQIARALASKDGEDEEEPTFSELYRESEEEKSMYNCGTTADYDISIIIGYGYPFQKSFSH